MGGGVGGGGAFKSVGERSQVVLVVVLWVKVYVCACVRVYFNVCV